MYNCSEVKSGLALGFHHGRSSGYGHSSVGYGHSSGGYGHGGTGSIDAALSALALLAFALFLLNVLLPQLTLGAARSLGRNVLPLDLVQDTVNVLTDLLDEALKLQMARMQRANPRFEDKTDDGDMELGLD